LKDICIEENKMEYKIRIIDDDENPNEPIYEVNIHHVNYPNMKSSIEKMQVMLEENIHPIKMIWAAENKLWGFPKEFYMLYFTRKLAKAWLRKHIPCSKEDVDLHFRGVEYKGE